VDPISGLVQLGQNTQVGPPTVLTTPAGNPFFDDMSVNNASATVAVGKGTVTPEDLFGFFCYESDVFPARSTRR